MKKIILIFCGIISLVILIFIIASPSSETKFNAVTVQNKFNISIPEYLIRTDGLDSAALLQYKNEKEQMFFLVYEKTDSSSIENFFKKFSDDFISKLENGTLMNFYPEKINSSGAIIGNIQGNIKETRVFYKIAIIKSGSKFYKILIGVSANNRLDYEEDFTKIISSIKVNL